MNADHMYEGQALFARYAYPPNELGYCGPTDGGGTSGLASHAKEFDGAWPYLTAIAEAVGDSDPLDEDVVGSYWVGGPSLAEGRPRGPARPDCGQRSRDRSPGCSMRFPPPPGCWHTTAFTSSWSTRGSGSWTAMRRPRSGVMQDCRIRWGTVESVEGEHAVIASRPLQLDRRQR